MNKDHDDTVGKSDTEHFEMVERQMNEFCGNVKFLLIVFGAFLVVMLLIEVLKD